MSIYSDFRFLASKDIRHKQLRWMPDIWWQANEAKGLILLIEYDTDGVSPLIGVALLPEICPVDPTATLRIKYWVGNLDKDITLLKKKLVESSLKIIQKMKQGGYTKVWGMVPQYAVHIVNFLDGVVADGKCTRINGNDIMALLEAVDLITHDYKDHYFYIAKNNEAEQYMKGI